MIFLLAFSPSIYQAGDSHDWNDDVHVVNIRAVGHCLFGMRGSESLRH